MPPCGCASWSIRPSLPVVARPQAQAPAVAGLPPWSFASVVWAQTWGRTARVATWPIGVEVGVRWMRVEPHASGRVAVSWYQDLIPLRIACTRGDGAPTIDHHGLRVAVYTP